MSIRNTTRSAGGRGLAGLLIGAVAAAVLALPVAQVPALATSNAPQAAVPLLAFYYVWFDPSSWNRAKTDYPQLGNYSSDDPRILRQHIEWARSAGIDGFIVSWKDTPTNDRRLRLLMGVAAQLNFKLAMIYQGLDFGRKPLPASQVAADFATFRDQYASDPVFYRMGGKPLTIWSGTWAYSHADVAAVTGAVRGSMLVLNTEKSVDGYQRIADVTDGDAYYWSSVNPDTNDSYGAKLAAMSTAIHRRGQYWIAPFAPGFDARLVGGTRAVDRKNGQTLREEYATALRSSPDALGLISWNEFSENSYVEPSRKYGSRYLDVLRELRHTAVAVPPSASDSSEAAGPAAPPGTAGTFHGSRWPAFLLIAFPLVLLVGMGLLGYRRRRRTRPPGPSVSVPAPHADTVGAGHNSPQ